MRMCVRARARGCVCARAVVGQREYGKLCQLSGTVGNDAYVREAFNNRKVSNSTKYETFFNSLQTGL